MVKTRVLQRLAHMPWWVPLVVGLTVRLGAVAYWQTRLPSDRAFVFPDSESYWELGQAVAHGGPYQFRSPDRQVFRTPGFPIMLAPLFLGGWEAAPVWGGICSALWGMATIGALFCLTKLWFNQETAMLASWIAALYPGAIAMGSVTLTEAPFSCFMLLQFYCWQWSLHETRRKQAMAWSLAAGLAAGWATLIRPGWLYFTPMACFAQLISAKDRARFWGPALVLVGLVAVMSPWWIRNAVVTGKFVPTTLQVGASLYDGLNPHSDGGSDMTHGDQFAASIRATNKAPLTEYELDRELRSAALAWAKDNPTEAVRLAFVKFLRTWSPIPNERSFRSLPANATVGITYFATLSLAIVGLYKNSENRELIIWSLLAVLYFAALHMVFVGSIRYRQPVMVLLMCPAAAVVREMFLPNRHAATTYIRE